MDFEYVEYGNKLIANHMGLDYVHVVTEDCDIWYAARKDSDSVFESFYSYADIPYHSSWDWRMAIVRKIAESGYAGGVLYALRSALIEADSEASYVAIVEFIEWYNCKQKESK